MTPDSLLARLEADLRVRHALDQAERPEGLTASRVGGCRSMVARLLLHEPQHGESDIWRAFVGSAGHDRLNDTLAAIDPGFTDGRGNRYLWERIPGLPVSGEYDFLLDGIPVEVKFRPRAECRWHAGHGAAPDHCIQVALAADALGADQAFVIYMPVGSGADWSEAVACPVDVRSAVADAVVWLEQADVRQEVEDHLAQYGGDRAAAVAHVLESVPRDMPVNWCVLFCRWVKDCRTYEPPPDLEIQNPVMREAAIEAERQRQIRLEAGRLEQAALSQIRHVEGVVHDRDSVVRVDQQVVAPTAGRRGHKRTRVERRPG